MMSEQQREIARDILSAALRAVDPAQAVRRHVQRQRDLLRVGERSYDLTQIERVFVIGVGKASPAMATAIAHVLDDRLTAGWVNTKYGHRRPFGQEGTPSSYVSRLTFHECGHPIPDESGVAGAHQIMALAKKTTARDLVVTLLSGGGSALMVAPAEGLTLADKQTVTRLLLGCGATINELNCVRKHLSAVKGGQLARLAYPAQVVTLILSDVVGNALDVIASGPTVPDPTTYADARAILDRYRLWDEVPPPVRKRLEDGLAGRLPDTPKEGDSAFAGVYNLVIGSNELAAQAAVRRAQELGFHALLLSTYVEGEAREVGKVLAGILREMAASGQPVARPGCVVVGGETTVTLRGKGMGGRNQELALAAAMKIAGLPDVLVVACGTDGTDGPTDAAGAFADGTTVERARSRGLDPAAYLAKNDSYHFFEALGDLLLTGPTGTNVNDLTLLIAFA